MFEEEGARSLIGITKQDQWPDILQEKIRLAGHIGLSMKGMSFTKFIITLPSVEEITEISHTSLREWFDTIRDWSH